MISEAATRAVPGLPPWDLRLAAVPWAILTAATVVGAVMPVWRVATGSPAAALGGDGA